MSSDLYHVDTEGNHSRVGHVGNGQLRVDLRELDAWTQGDIFRMIADIARDPTKHFHEWGDPEEDAKTARELVLAFTDGVDVEAFARTVMEMRAGR